MDKPETLPQEKIGHFIRRLRERKGLTQTQFAQALETSQSAVARVEAGSQNLTTAQLDKISHVLGRKIVSINDGSIDFSIQGGKTLSGSVTTNTSKNGAVALLCASLINHSPTTLKHVPQIEEIYRLLEIFESIGVETTWQDDHTLRITPPQDFSLDEIDTEAARKVRSSLMMIGSLCSRLDEFMLPHAGGCKMGERTIAAHRHAFEHFGISVTTEEENYHIDARQMDSPNTEVVMYEASDTATINALLAAAGVAGESTISFASSNYQVQDVCFYLQKLGIKITGIGTSTLTVRGKDTIDADVEHSVSEDPIEAMMWISAALVTKSKLEVKRAPIDFLKLELLKLKTMGAKIEQSDEYTSHNDSTALVDLSVLPSKLVAPDVKIHALPYPGINTDNLPFFAPIATQASGTTHIHDWMWETRAIYFTELNRLGADVKLADPHRVFITGPTDLRAAQIVCPPALRPSMIILIAMLAAEGTSTLRNVYPIKRGYADIANRLRSIGAEIEVIDGIS